VAGDPTPKMNYLNSDGSTTTTVPSTFASANDVSQLPSYITLNKNLGTYNNILVANRLYFPNPVDPSLTKKKDYYTPSGKVGDAYVNNPNTDVSLRDPTKVLAPKHQEIVKLREELDTKLMELNNVQNSMYGSSKLQTDASIYVTILWTTLATAMIYYTFVHM
jgi:hypothetical protein